MALWRWLAAQEAEPKELIASAFHYDSLTMLPPAHWAEQDESWTVFYIIIFFIICIPSI